MMTPADDDVLTYRLGLKTSDFRFGLTITSGESYITLHYTTLHYITFQVRPHHYIRSILPRGPVGVAAAFWNGDQLLEVMMMMMMGRR